MTPIDENAEGVQTIRFNKFTTPPINDVERAAKAASEMVRAAYTLPALFEGKVLITKLGINADRATWEIHVEIEEAPE